MNLLNILFLFFQRIPELEQQIKGNMKQAHLDETDGAYAIWELAVFPCVKGLLAYPEQNRITLKKVFCFFEQMACAQEEVRELLMYAILEELGDEKEVLQRAQRFMGENTLELSNRVENFLGR